ncbi:MAG: hypothetical protein ABJG15_09965 [Hyphomonadaceae bacterium]
MILWIDYVSNLDMKDRLVYVELKSGYSDDGPAWIGIAGASKTGATVYFNGDAFKSLKGSGIGANFFDIETLEEYWISGIKKNNQDRHWAGGGQIAIDRTAVERYLAEMDWAELPSNLVIADLAPSKQRDLHSKLEHRPSVDWSEQYSRNGGYGRNGKIKGKI